MWQNNYVIREAREKDLPQIHAIFNERITNSTCIFAYETVSMESRVAWLNELKGKGYPVIVAAEKASDKAIAYACLNTFRPHPAYVLTSELSLYIDQNHQRQGLGTALLQELLRIGHEMSFHSIIASITADNTASTLLFLKHQFK
ncbi:acyl-CoA N-acyltransferase, partial [Sporodiniella umbellata]